MNGVSLRELFASMGVLKVVDPMIEEAYERVERRIFEDPSLDDVTSERGYPWHTSFHASAFPGPNVKGCGRQNLYAMMGASESEPIQPRLRALMDAGKDIEMHTVRRLYEAGMLIAGSPEDDSQLGLVDVDHWLTGSVDAVVLPPGWNKGHVVELKGKDHERVMEMGKGKRTWEAWHESQLHTYIQMCYEVSPILWPDLDPVESGSLIYFSRQRPRTTVEYLFDRDPAFVAFGREQLKEWRKNFEERTLPERDSSWRWTEDPCDYCEYKRDVCKPDHQAGITSLLDSHLVEHAKGVRPDYDPEEAIAAVEARWAEELERAEGASVIPQATLPKEDSNGSSN